MVKEMIGGCCVCLDERGWNENPLVYCDGSSCNVAVHQACYGIVKVPSGPWYCCKCMSTERIARVKCELCPIKEGALKRTDSGGWAHVVCALYIPEVRFGNVSSMEPIILSSVPHERFAKPCYLCDEEGRDSKLSNGACMACHKPGCKLSFHVTCAQSRRLLCEEASVNGNVQYVGYCRVHWTKRLKQQQQQQRITSTGTVISDQEVKKSFKDKKFRQRTESTSSTNSNDLSSSQKMKKKLGRPPEKINGDTDVSQTDSLTSLNKKSKLKEPSFSVNGLLSTETKLQTSSPLNTPVDKEHAGNIGDKNSSDDNTKPQKLLPKKRKSKDKEKPHKKVKLKNSGDKNWNSKDIKLENIDHDSISKEKKKTKKKNGNLKLDSSKSYPQPSKLGLVENGKITSLDSIASKSVEIPDNFQDFLELQWNHSAQFILSKAEHFDVASLLKTLHQLKGDNAELEKRLLHLQSRRDRLLGVNARLAASFAKASQGDDEDGSESPLSSMLNKLNDNTPPLQKQDSRYKRTPEQKLASSENNVSSPDLAMLAAASAKVESNSLQGISSHIPATDKNSIEETPFTLLQPSLASHCKTSLAPHCNGISHNGLHKESLFDRNSPTRHSERNDTLDEDSESTDSAEDSSSND